MKKYAFLILLLSFFMLSFIYPIEYEVVKGDCLWNIAKQHYKDPFLWKKIYEVNKEKIKNPDLIYPGQKFVLPDLQEEFPEEKVELKEEQELEETISKETIEKIEAEKEELPSQFKREEVVSKLTEKFPKKIKFEEYKFDGKIINGKEKKFIYIDFDNVYIKAKNLTNINSGDILGVYHKGPSKYDINLMNVHNDETNLVGIAKIKEINENSITAEIIKAFSPILIGDLIKYEKK
jgi:LysM repeat protein